MSLTRVLFMLLFISAVNSFWFFGGKSSDDSQNQENVEVVNSKDSSFKHVPFEIKTMDDRLMKETFSLSQLSNLDNCFHGVMSELEGSCVSMSEEDLSKLSVRLMNCQSRVEGRRTYPCTWDMELRDCTSDMDETVWNSYQIISNRARSVCYQIRHQQFRLKTELTVNKLVESSEEQLKSLREMEAGHDLLRELTEDVIKRVEEGQTTLLDKQLEMNEVQKQVEQQIERNRQKISEEQQLVSSGNVKLVQIAEKIQNKLDNATDQISDHARVQLERHEELMDDMERIATETRKVVESLDEGKVQVKVMREQTDEHFEDVVKNLMVINGTVAYLAELICDVKYYISDKLNLVMFYVNMSGKDIQFLTKVGLHILYIFGLMILLAFFNIDSTFKLLLLVLVVCNVSSLVYCDQSLHFSSLTMVLLFFIIGYHIAPSRRQTRTSSDVKIIRDEANVTEPEDSESGLSSGDIQKVIRALEKWRDRCVETPETILPHKPTHLEIPQRIEEDISGDNDDVFPFVAPITPSRRLGGLTMNSPVVHSTPKSIRRHLLQEFEMEEIISRRLSRNNSPARTPLLSNRNKSPSRLNESFFNRSLRPACTSLTKAGLNCKLPCQEGSMLCHIHNNATDD